MRTSHDVIVHVFANSYSNIDLNWDRCDMDDFTAVIGRETLPRTEDTKCLYELEEEASECLKRAAQE
jgi:hypothetical protein